MNKPFRAEREVESGKSIYDQTYSAERVETDA